MNKNIIGFFASLFIIANTHLHSQSNDSIYGIDLNEVIVSTPFMENRLNNVLKIEKQSIADLNFTKSQSITKAIDNIPGLSVINTGPAISKPVIRGLSFNRVVLYNNNTKYDNMQWGDEHGLEIASAGIESIEYINCLLYTSDAADDQ